VHDQHAVRIFDRRADLPEQIESDRDHCIVRCIDQSAPAVQRGAIDVLHDQVGPAAVAVAGIEQPDDARMIQTGQDPALGIEGLAQAAAEQKGLEELDCDPALEGSVAALGQVHGAAAAAAQRVQQPPRTQLLARPGRGVQRGPAVEQGIFGGVRPEQGADLVALCLTELVCAGQPRLAIAFGMLQRAMERGEDSLPVDRFVVRIHPALRHSWMAPLALSSEETRTRVWHDHLAITFPGSGFAGA